MLASGNHEMIPILPPNTADIAIGVLLGFLAQHREKPLVFFHDGRPVRPGYHVTEVKAGRFDALDCGANEESWTEIFVQLWDVNEEGAHMPAGKFAAIIGKVAEHVSLDRAAKLTFEVSDGVRPIALYRAALPELVAGEVHVQLSPRPASCKPRDRWLEEEQKRRPVACCGPASEGAQPSCP